MKKNFLFAIIIILMLSISACSKKSNEKAVIDDIVDQADATDVEVVKNIIFDERLEEFNKIYKKALLLTGQENTEEAVKTTKEAYDLWIVIFNDFVNNQPKEYRETRDWALRMKSLSSEIVAAESFAERGEMKEAHEKLELVRKNIREIREENNIKNISSDMLVFHDIMEELLLIKTKAEAETKIVELKISFATLKSYNYGNLEYEEMIQKLEKAISEIDNSTEDIFKEKSEKLKPIFVDFYMQFG